MDIYSVILVLTLIFTEYECADYCKWENFEGKCPDHQVITIDSAKWGRIDKGRCIDRDYGYVGCATDVLSIAENKCSGKQKCTIEVPDRDMDLASANACPEDLKSYLSINYSCLKTVNAHSSRCILDIDTSSTRALSPEGSHSVTSVGPSPHAFIGSVSTKTTGCGRNDKPWIIKLKEGQAINITLHDYSSGSPGHSTCKVYAIIKDLASGKSKTVCGGMGRLTNVYHAKTTKLEIRIMQGIQEKYFLLEYNVIGCPEITAPPRGWVKYEKESAVVGCENSDTTWTLKCEGNSWAGEYGMCGDQVHLEAAVDFPAFRVNKTISAVIVACVAVVLGLAILAAGIIILKRRRNNPYDRPQIPQMKELPPDYHSNPPPSYYTGRNTSPHDHEYEYVSDFAPYSTNRTAQHPNIVCGQHPNVHIPIAGSDISSAYTGTGYGTLPPATPPLNNSAGNSFHNKNKSIGGNVYVPDNISLASSSVTSKYFELDLNGRVKQVNNPGGGDQHVIHNNNKQAPVVGNIGEHNVFHYKQLNPSIGGGGVGGSSNATSGNSNISGSGDSNAYKSLHNCAQNSKQNFGHYSQ